MTNSIPEFDATAEVAVKSHFKQVRDKASPKYGIKRDDLHWSFAGLTADSVIVATPEQAEAIAVIVNDSLEKYGKGLLLANTDNWEFTPDSEKVSVAALYAALTSETTRSRTLTKVTLGALGEFYEKFAVVLLGKTTAQASAGNTVIAKKLAPIAAKPDAVDTICGNLLALVEAVGEATTSADLTEIQIAEMNAEFETHAPVIEALLEYAETVKADIADIGDAL